MIMSSSKVLLFLPYNDYFIGFIYKNLEHTNKSKKKEKPQYETRLPKDTVKP